MNKQERLKIFYELANATWEPLKETKKTRKPVIVDTPVATRASGQPPFVVTFDEDEPNADAKTFLTVNAKDMYFFHDELTGEQVLELEKRLKASEHWSKIPKEQQDEALRSVWDNYTHQLVERLIREVIPPPEPKGKKKLPLKKKGTTK